MLFAKKIHKWTLFLILPLLGALSSQATPFRGYIVKLNSTNSNTQFLESKTFLAKYQSVKQVVNTSFGVFAQLQSATEVAIFQKQLVGSKDFKIAYIEPNYIISIKDTLAAPHDSQFTEQWALNNTGKNGPESAGKAHADINALKAWSLTQGNAKNPIKIAVIDTGVNYNHPDLQSQMDVNTAELNGEAGVDDDGNGFIDDIYGYNFSDDNGDPLDGGGHGTHCAGVIGAAHNDEGIAGVMANVKIVALKFLNDDGDGEEINAIKAIDYGIKRGVKVMSNSWGGEDRLQALEDAIQAAGDAGVVFIAAAGNDHADNDKVKSFPANFNATNLISVGAFDSWGKLASFSNFGRNSVHVLAPGSGIISTYLADGYETMSGTSMATPHIAGIVGLLLSLEPNLTPLEVRERLMRTSLKSAELEPYSASGGRIDAYNVLKNITE